MPIRSNILRKVSRYLLLCLVLSSESLAVMAEAPRIQTTLILEHERDNIVFANLTFQNIGTDTAYLWKRLALLDGRLNAERFIVTQDDKIVEYIGLTAKIREPQAGDFLPLGPGESARTRILLNNGYAIALHGRLKVQYQAYNPSVTGSGALTRLISNVAVLDLP